MIKTCKDCLVDKQIEDFYKHKNSKDGYSHRCKKCDNKRTRLWQINNKEKAALNTKRHREKYGKEYKEKTRNYKYIINYGITLDDWKRLLEDQNYRCGICFKHSSEETMNMVVDHDHKTGVIRGLLCRNCNTALGLLKDSVENMKSAIDYLESTIITDINILKKDA